MGKRCGLGRSVEPNYVVVPVCLPHCAYAGEDERELGRAAARQVEQVCREVQECDLLNAADSIPQRNYSEKTTAQNRVSPRRHTRRNPPRTCSDLRSRRIASIISTLTCAVQRKHSNAKPHLSIRAAHTRTRLNHVAPCASRDAAHISYY